MSDFPSTFFWYELVTTDPRAATDFYAHVVGWKPEPFGGPGSDYMVMNMDRRGVAGIIATPEAAKGAPPAWMGYVYTDDVDATAKTVVAAGGSIHHGPLDIPEVGRFAVVADPQGAHFMIMKPGMEGGGPAPIKPGFVGWHELMSADWKKAFDFYAKVFGWTKDQTIPMGEMGDYQLFAAGKEAIGGMMNKPETMPVSAWGFYFIVPELDAALDRVKAKGGKVIFEPVEVPGGAWACNAVDAQGAAFGLTADRR
ncbi:MAG: VOC family protein [Rhizobiaceae bacterium]